MADERKSDGQENRPRNPQKEDEARFPASPTGKESGVQDPTRRGQQGGQPGQGGQSGQPGQRGRESGDVIDPSGEMEAAGKQRGVPGDIAGDDPSTRRPAREDDDQQYQPPRRGDDRTQRPIEPDQEPWSKGQRGA